MAGETRQKILDAAEKLIALKGLARVTTKEIARETGLSEGALYRHFDHKEEIFIELLLKYLPSFIETLETHPPGSGAVRDNLLALAQATMSYYEQLVGMGAAFFSDTELLTQFRDKISSMGVGPQTFILRVAGYIEQEQRLGRIVATTSARTLASLLLGPCFQYVFNRGFLGRDPFERSEQDVAAEIVQGLLPAILPGR